MNVTNIWFLKLIFLEEMHCSRHHFYAFYNQYKIFCILCIFIYLVHPFYNETYFVTKAANYITAFNNKMNQLKKEPLWYFQYWILVNYVLYF